ncbi:MAG: DUF3459 domain-containing protein [Dehalococcoidia bacterium]|nr:DUF3459 domain-containing protein [Dehalococcoidia bacterium]
MHDQAGHEWWRSAVFYQLYPRSFQDANGDGIGDLEGIIRRLDYLNDGTPRSLGIDAIWLSPTFPSPMKDFGYDVSDYRGVDPAFGDMAAMERLIAEAHRRGIRILLDYVPNHTSDQHPWFIDSRSSRDAAHRDWYVWRDPPPGGGFPNNWVSAFGGPAWTFDEHTGQYYLHSFLREQPDLNWRNPEVESAMHDVLRFWLDRGIDGFRIDVMGMVVKHPDLADNPPNPEWTPGHSTYRQFLWTNNRNYPDVFETVRGIRRVFDAYDERMAVAEVFGTPAEIANYYGGEKLDGLHLAFNFQFIHESDLRGGFTPWDARTIHRLIESSERDLPPGAQPCWAFGNHDRPRFISRHNSDGRGDERGRAAALLLLGLRGTPFVYYGDEIGMVDNTAIPEERRQDPARYHSIWRDPARTPMQWDASPGRGFSRAEPWLPFGPADISVAAQDHDPDSMLSLYRDATWARRNEPALREGTLELLAANDLTVAFIRRAAEGRAVLVAVNTSAGVASLPMPAPGRVIIATERTLDRSLAGSLLRLPPFSAAWVALE